MRRLMALSWILPGCLVDVKFDDVLVDVDPIDSGVDPRGEDPDEWDEGTTEGNDLPATINSWYIECDDEGREIVEVSVDSIAGVALLFQQETANMPPQWSEEHPLFMQTESLFTASLEDRTLVTEWIPGESTVFWCDNHIDLEIPIMTYAIAVFDGEGGEMYDCVVFGHDPQGLIEDAYPTVGTGPSFPLESCRTVY